MKALHLIARAATAITTITTTTTTPTPTFIPNITTTNSTWNSTLPTYGPPLFQNADFSDCNLVTFINTDSTPRTLIFTPGYNMTIIPKLNISGHETLNQSFPNHWNGNFYSYNTGIPFIASRAGILGEVTFGVMNTTWFDISSIVNANDTEGVKILMPAVSKWPFSGCRSYVDVCENSYVWSKDDKETRSTQETALLCYIGNGMGEIVLPSQNQGVLSISGGLLPIVSTQVINSAGAYSTTETVSAPLPTTSSPMTPSGHFTHYRHHHSKPQQALSIAAITPTLPPSYGSPTTIPYPTHFPVASFTTSYAPALTSITNPQKYTTITITDVQTTVVIVTITDIISPTSTSTAIERRRRNHRHRHGHGHGHRRY